MTSALDILAYSDYYPYGSVMPGRNLVNSPAYKNGYQGQYAEKDAETGYDAFDLRMYDANLGRWISPDPYGQFHSTYVGMGNNPVSQVDPDGGWSTLLSMGVGAVAGAGIAGIVAYNNGANHKQAMAWGLGGAVSGAAAGYGLHKFFATPVSAGKNLLKIGLFVGNGGNNGGA